MITCENYEYKLLSLINCEYESTSSITLSFLLHEEFKLEKRIERKLFINALW